MGMESIITSMELNMRVTGEMIFNMVKEKNLGPMAQFIKESTLEERNMELESIAGMTAVSTKEIGMKTKLKGLEPIVG